MSTLADKKLEFTKNLILEAACMLTETLDINELSYKKVSEQAGVSERTMFRYYRSRETFLDALTGMLISKMHLPDIPESVTGLKGYGRDLYKHLETQPRRVSVLLSSELLPRVYATTAKTRLEQLIALLASSYPNAPQKELIKTAANVRYVLSASSWHHYRMNFRFELETCIECAELMVSQAIGHLEQLTASE